MSLTDLLLIRDAYFPNYIDSFVKTGSCFLLEMVGIVLVAHSVISTINARYGNFCKY